MGVGEGGGGGGWRWGWGGGVAIFLWEDEIICTTKNIFSVEM